MSAGLLARLRAGLARTREAVTVPLRGLSVRGGRLDEDTCEQLEEILIGADVGVETATRLVEAVRERARGRRDVDGERVLAWLGEELRELLADGAPAPWPASGPLVAMLVGVNGTGKTTTLAKLAWRWQREGRRVMLAAADTFRAAAGEQLAAWAARLEADLIRQPRGADAGAVAFDAIRAAQARGADAVLVDTAGRLHTRANLMSELQKVRRVCGRALDGAPHQVLLVIDATTGQNGLVQAREFTGAVEVDGIVLTKLDGTARGGIAVAIRDRLGLPVRWVGFGEDLADFAPFDPDLFVSALLGVQALDGPGHQG